jgi:cell division protease FtsH
VTSDDPEDPLARGSRNGGHLPGDDPSRTPGRSEVQRDDERPSAGEVFSRMRPPWWQWALLLALVVGMGVATSMLVSPEQPEEYDYSEFVALVEEGEVDEITIDEDGNVRGELSDGTPFETTVPIGLPLEELESMLHEQEVAVEAEPPAPDWIASLIWFVPFLLIVGFFIWLFYRARGQMGQIQGMGKSQAQVIDTERPDTTFDDIAGYDDVKQEVVEIIDYLEDPDRFRRLGARGPGGVLLVGPPGTGKTLIARAVAAEAGVPFISAAGSEFVEMLVGVGASRVRDLFEKAREREPAIIFIDELDSVGRKRGGASTIGSNNEQEQTLNQLLAEMDGFDPAEGIVVIAATNRPEMLDPALLRPGRFDRQIQVPLPTLGDRIEILEVHIRGKPVAADVDLDRVARATPGFSGAQLENLVNEAAINAVRADREEITHEDFEAARDRIMIGKRRGSDILRPEERERVAIHEAGHAMVAALCDEADPVAKVTILPARQALGTTEQLPLDERRLHAEGYLHDTLAVRLGGRVAELIVLGEASSGAAHDLTGATQIATKMVREFGLSPELGPVGWQMSDPQGESVPDALRSRPYAEATQEAIDGEVERILREAEQRAAELIHQHRDEFDALVERLLEEEALDGEAVYEIVGREMPRREGEPEKVPGRATVDEVDA